MNLLEFMFSFIVLTVKYLSSLLLLPPPPSLSLTHTYPLLSPVIIAFMYMRLGQNSYDWEIYQRSCPCRRLIVPQLFLTACGYSSRTGAFEYFPIYIDILTGMALCRQACCWEFIGIAFQSCLADSLLQLCFKRDGLLFLTVFLFLKS